MFLRKFPKRNILLYPAELKDLFSLLVSSSLLEGPSRQIFEKEFGSFIGIENALSVSSGRFALSLILKNIGLKRGDGIILSAYNYPGVPQLLLKEGFCAQFVDADGQTYQIDTQQIESRIKRNTRAIIATHLFGQPSDMHGIMDIAARRGLSVIEDAAHSLGSFYAGRHTGTIAEAGFFSFSGSKILNTSFGGMTVTNNPVLAERMRRDLSAYHFPQTRSLIGARLFTYVYALVTNRVLYSIFGYPLSLAAGMLNMDPFEMYNAGNHREIAEEKMFFTNFQALIGLRYLRFMNDLIAKREEYTKRLFAQLDPSIHLQKYPEGCRPNYFMIALKARDKVSAYKKLLLKGVDTSLGYAYDCSYVTGETGNPVAGLLGKQLITIHLPFVLNDREISHLAKAVNGIKEWLR